MKLIDVRGCPVQFTGAGSWYPDPPQRCLWIMGVRLEEKIALGNPNISLYILAERSAIPTCVDSSNGS